MGKLVQLISHPKELKAVIQLIFFKKPLHKVAETQTPTLSRCYELLNLTSRSFAAVIKELHPDLQIAVMLFYLTLRALDTVEDDMTLDSKVKIPLLRTFDEKLKEKDWTFDGNGPDEKDRIVLVEFDKILAEFHKLNPEYQDIISDITKKMGNGMADYILDENYNTNGVNTVEDYDLYCHYVAGLVGEGLTKLMVSAKFADKSLVEDNFAKSESMGLFLQKTNIIRDYHEDLEDGRSFWPKEVWSKYTDVLFAFHKDPSKQADGLACINELVLDTLRHVKDVLTYLSLVSDPSCFSFCAIPQVMAIATLATVYNNPDVLHSNVKIRKGTTVDLILRSRTLPGVVAIFREYIRVINHKSSVIDPNYLKIGIKCGELEQFCELMYPSAGAIPKGVKKSLKPINQNILSRHSIDKSIQSMITKEATACNIALLAILSGFIAISTALYAKYFP